MRRVMLKIGIITLPGANVDSVRYWIKRSGFESTEVSHPDQIAKLNCMILPGVGAFDSAMTYLVKTGLKQAVIDYSNKGGNLIGICLGMQIMFESSEEGKASGLSLLEGHLIRIPDGVMRVPNIGWRAVNRIESEGKACQKALFFFMHSYGLPLAGFTDASVCERLETVEHNTQLVATFRKKNLLGFQFHPEKSYLAGDRVLKDFLHEIQSDS
jgi:imidazole glycerol-phosphate synthase subunit HisH